MNPELQEALDQLEAVKTETGLHAGLAIEIVKAAALIKQANNTTPAA